LTLWTEYANCLFYICPSYTRPWKGCNVTLRCIFSWNSLFLLLLCINIVISLWIKLVFSAKHPTLSLLSSFWRSFYGFPLFFVLHQTKTPNSNVISLQGQFLRIHRKSSEFCGQTKAHLLLHLQGKSYHLVAKLFKSYTKSG